MASLLDTLETDMLAREEYSFEIFEDIFVPMRDGVKLCGDLYMPTKVPGVVKFPVVLTRTPYNKSAQNPDQRSPGLYWVQHGYCFFIQDVRGRFKSEGEFYKYTGEAEDGYDTVEWLARQSWCNGSVCTDGPSYLCHVQTSMALLRPPHLKAMFCNKGGFFNAYTSGIRNGGAFEARQWVWAFKNAPRKTSILKKAFEEVDLGAWMTRYPFKKGDSPLSLAPAYERFIFDQLDHTEYDDFWKQMGFNTEVRVDDFANIPCVFLSGWYDIYARSTIEFFTSLIKAKKGPMVLIMGPWQHVGAEGHVAGEVDFGMQALVDGNLAPNHYALTRSWFDKFVKNENAPRNLKTVTYFRMGGGDGHKTSAGNLYHGGMWLYAKQWPPQSIRNENYYLRKRIITTVNHNDVAPVFKEDSSEDDEYFAEHNPDYPPANLPTEHYSSYLFDPLNPKPSLGGNVFPYKNVLFSGAYDQRERPEHFLCKPPYLPISSRRDVLVFRTEPLKEDLDVTGTPKVVLFISSTCVDTDFTAMLIDEYPASEDYPTGFALNVTHGIIRCRYRHSITKPQLLEPKKVYEVKIEMYPTSNLFRRGHVLRLDISSSNYPHFDINMNTGEKPSVSQRYQVADNTVFHCAVFPSRIVLPVNFTAPVVKNLVKRGYTVLLPDVSLSPSRALDPKMITPNMDPPQLVL